MAERARTGAHPTTGDVPGREPPARVRIAAVSAHFGRNLRACHDRIADLVAQAREHEVDLLVLPDGALGGYLPDLVAPARTAPPSIAPNGPDIKRVATLARGDLTICFGYTEILGDRLSNAVACVHDGQVLGRYRKIHTTPAERGIYTAGDRLEAFDTPVGRLGMLIDYDKTFPEAARTLVLDGANIVACLSAWPASLTGRSIRINQDRQSRLFDLYDRCRAAENQIVWVSANQVATHGSLQFLGQSKIVGPGGDVRASTAGRPGLALADVDVDLDIDRSRRVLNHLADRRSNTYESGAASVVAPASPTGASAAGSATSCS